MIVEDPARLLARLAASPLEDAAFSFTEPGGAPSQSGAVMEARLSLCGRATAVLTRRAPPGLARTLGAHLPGADPADPRTDGHRGDAPGELLDIIAGASLSEIEGPGRPARPGAPVVRELPQGAAAFAEGVPVARPTAEDGICIEVAPEPATEA